MESVDLGRIAGWSAVLLVLLVLFAIVAFVVRRRVFRDDSNNGSGGFDMLDISRLREHGQLTEEEYRAVRRSTARSWSDGADS